MFPTDIDECASTPCLNGGTCIDGIDEWSCQCAGQWTGDRCEICEQNSPNLRSYNNSILFYSVLFYSILFYSILFYSILFYSILFYSILFYSVLFYSILFYSILFYSILFYYILFSAMLFYSNQFN